MSFKHKIPVTVYKSSFKHKFLVTTVYKKFLPNTKFWLQFTKISFKHNSGYSLQNFLQTQNSGYNSLQKVPSNTKFWLQQFTKSSFKHKILVTLTKLPSTKFWLQFTKVPSSTNFWLQFTKISFKHKIPVTVYKSSFKHKILVTTVYKKFLQTQNSGYSLQKFPSNTIPFTVYKSSFKHKILVTVYKKFP